MTDITVQYERKFSDGNYGSEGLSLSWTVSYDDSASELAADPEVIRARCAHIAASLRASVLTELAKSEARNVAYAAQRELNPPPPRVPVAAGQNYDPEESPF